MQGRDDNREESASTVPCPEPEKLPGGQASVSTPLQSASDSPSLEKATPATPTSSSHGLPSGEEPAQGGADSAEAVVDDVFSTADEVLLVPDSPQKEFHCAVVRALSKEPSVVEAAKADLAPGRTDEAESCLKSGLPLPSFPAQPWPVSLPTAALGLWESLPAVSSPSTGGLESAAAVLPCASILPTHSSIFEAFA